jgi:ribosomal protein L7Ae-like RNA K-turn-binding protein
MLKKSQMMVLGTENVIELIKSGKSDFVLFAEDISDNSRQKIDFYIQKSSVKSESLLTKDQLSDMTTLANCSVLAFKKNSLTAQLIQAVKLYKKVLNT